MFNQILTAMAKLPPQRIDYDKPSSVEEIHSLSGRFFWTVDVILDIL